MTGFRLACAFSITCQSHCIKVRKVTASNWQDRTEGTAHILLWLGDSVGCLFRLSWSQVLHLCLFGLSWSQALHLCLFRLFFLTWLKPVFDLGWGWPGVLRLCGWLCHAWAKKSQNVRQLQHLGHLQSPQRQFYTVTWPSKVLICKPWFG